MDIDRKVLEHVAAIARLNLSEDEIKKYLPQLKEALEFFSRLNEIDTENVEPSFHPVELKNVMRKDVEMECLSQGDALSLTEHRKDGYFKGPKSL